MAVLCLLVVIGDVARLLHGVDRADLSLAGAGSGATNYLLVGSDAWSSSQSGYDEQSLVTGLNQRADLIMVLHVPAAGPPTVLSIPRDLLTPMPNLGAHRITLGLTRGPQLLVDTLCHSLGLGIDHVVVVNIAGFRGLVDAVGGVDVDLPYAIREPKLGLDIEAAGVNHLDGEAALKLVRSRHSEELRNGQWQRVPDGAESRIVHSQVVMRALGAAVEAKASTLWGQHQLASALAGTVTVDRATGRGTIQELAQALRSARDEPSSLQQLPAITVDGPVPVASLAPGATEVLKRAGAGANPRCPYVPAVPSELPPGAPAGTGFPVGSDGGASGSTTPLPTVTLAPTTAVASTDSAR